MNDANKSLTSVIAIFKSVITTLLRTSTTRMRRVIFSKNNEGKQFFYSNNFKFIYKNDN
jgi:hypothetical protein